MLSLKSEFLLGSVIGLTLVAVACGERPGVHKADMGGADKGGGVSELLQSSNTSAATTTQPPGEPFTGEWKLTAVHCQGPEQIDVNALLSKVPESPAYSNYALTVLRAKEDGSVELSRKIAACVARIPVTVAVSEDLVTLTGGDIAYNYSRCSASMYLANHKYRPSMNIGTTAFSDMFSNKKNDFQFHVARDGKLYFIQAGKGFCADSAVLVFERAQ
jgi:hypothetical protein